MSGANRAPSSSVKNATVIGCRVATPCCSRVSITSSPASTPRLPSKRPPVATVSMCEPGHHRRRGRVRPGTGSDDVADRIDPDVESEVGHPADDEVAALPVGVGEREPRVAALPVRTGDRADLAQCLDARPEPFAVDPQLAALDPHVAHRNRNAAISASASQNVSTAASKSAAPALGRRHGRVTDHAVVAEVVGQPPERHRAAEAHMTVLGQVLRHPSRRPRRGRRARERGGA